MADIVIVGHGTSLEGSGLGSVIDSYDCPIVRFSGFNRGCRVGDVGSRVDYLCTNTRLFEFVLEDEIIPTRELWIYIPRSKGFEVLGLYGNCPLYIDNLAKWTGVYMKLREKGKHNTFCTGLAGIIISAKRLGVSNILLFGFDNLWIGDSDCYETLGLSRYRRARWSRRYGVVGWTVHDYAAERKMIGMISTEYGVGISHYEMGKLS